MASKVHGGLGKGLGALLQSTPVASVPPGEKVQEIKVSDIRANRYQPRQDFDEGALEELKESIKSYGVLQPVLVRKLPDGGYELVAGERRLRAAKLAGVEEIPALVSGSRFMNDLYITVEDDRIQPHIFMNRILPGKFSYPLVELWTKLFIKVIGCVEIELVRIIHLNYLYLREQMLFQHCKLFMIFLVYQLIRVGTVNIFHTCL